ncbi:hypothetical protein BC829DRAFT_267220 [Chytridium lagenaria]|nr:hypothetical protein BC829DRAFT_267220 [Chytridium lagenaria]
MFYRFWITGINTTRVSFVWGMNIKCKEAAIKTLLPQRTKQNRMIRDCPSIHLFTHPSATFLHSFLSNLQPRACILLTYLSSSIRIPSIIQHRLLGMKQRMDRFGVGSVSFMLVLGLSDQCWRMNGSRIWKLKEWRGGWMDICMDRWMDE